MNTSRLISEFIANFHYYSVSQVHVNLRARPLIIDTYYRATEPIWTCSNPGYVPVEIMNFCKCDLADTKEDKNWKHDERVEMCTADDN